MARSICVQPYCPLHWMIRKSLLPYGKKNFLDKTIEPLFSEDGQGYYYGEIHLTADDEVYLSAATETAVYVWKIENGQKTDTIVIDNSSYYPPKILDGIIFAIDMNEDNKRVVVIKTLSGETVYDGLLFPEDIPEMKLDPNGGVCGVVSGTEANEPSMLFTWTPRRT